MPKSIKEMSRLAKSHGKFGHTGVPFPVTEPNAFAYLDFAKWAKKKEKNLKKVLARLKDDKRFKAVELFWQEWDKKTNDGAFSNIKGNDFGRKLTVMLHQDNIIFDKNTHKIVQLKEFGDIDVDATIGERKIMNKNDIKYQLGIDYSGNTPPKVTKLNKKELKVFYGYKVNPKDVLKSLAKVTDVKFKHKGWSDISTGGGVHTFIIENRRNSMENTNLLTKIVKEEIARIKEARMKKVDKKWWKKANDDKRFDALLSVVKDPDDAEEYVEYKWERLPSGFERDMVVYESMIGEGKKFKPGDMWSDDFDYKGMLVYGMKYKPTGDLRKDINDMNSLHDSFEDVNYHSESASLWSAMKLYTQAFGAKSNPAKQGQLAAKGDAELAKFNKACAKTLKGLKEGLNEGKSYSDYGLSDEFSDALDMLPEKDFTPKNIVKLAKKMKQDPVEALKYAKDAFGWMKNMKEAFASYAQQKAAYASGYKGKGKKRKKESVDEAAPKMRQNKEAENIQKLRKAVEVARKGGSGGRYGKEFESAKKRALKALNDMITYAKIGV